MQEVHQDRELKPHSTTLRQLRTQRALNRALKFHSGLSRLTQGLNGSYTCLFFFFSGWFSLWPAPDFNEKHKVRTFSLHSLIRCSPDPRSTISFELVCQQKPDQLKAHSQNLNQKTHPLNSSKITKTHSCITTFMQWKGDDTKSLMNYIRDAFSFKYFISIIYCLLEVPYKSLHFTWRFNVQNGLLISFSCS